MMYRIGYISLVVTALLVLPLVAHCGPSPTLERSFAVEVGSALVELRVSYPQVMVAGGNYSVNVQLKILDIGSEESVELTYVSVEVEGTSIAAARVLKESKEAEGVLASEEFHLVVVDPSLDEIKGGEEKRYDLKVVVNLRAESKEGDESRVEYTAKLPVYIYSPPVYLQVDAEAPSEVKEGESFQVVVRVKNVGRYEVVDSGVRISGPVEIKGPDVELLGALKPGQEASAVFTVKAEEKGDLVLTATVWALNAAGYNHTESESLVVSVKGVPKLELYANTSGGRIKLYGWLNPPRPLATVVIEEEASGEWTPVASVAVDPSGYFEYSVQSPKAGTHRYRARWPGDEDYSPVESETVSVHLEKVASSILLSASSTVVEEGARVTLRGTISPAVSGTVHLFRNCGEGWTSVGYAVAKNGEFEAEVEVGGSVGSTCKFKAVWQGSEEVLGSESNIVEVKVKSRPALSVETAFWALACVVAVVLVWLVVRRVKRVQVRG